LHHHFRYARTRYERSNAMDGADMGRMLMLSPFARPAMSSKLPSVLSPTEEDIQMLLAAQCHIGTKNCDKQMLPYVWKRRVDGASALWLVLILLSNIN
jgi:hypothetical protein